MGLLPKDKITVELSVKDERVKEFAREIEKAVNALHVLVREAEGEETILVKKV